MRVESIDGHHRLGCWSDSLGLSCSLLTCRLVQNYGIQVDVSKQQLLRKSREALLFSHFCVLYDCPCHAWSLFLYHYYVRAFLCPMVQVDYKTRCRSLNLGPTAFRSVYPVETSTSLYNLYLLSQYHF